MRKLFWALGLSALVVAGAATAAGSMATSPYQVGVFYYPGWAPSTNPKAPPDPWQRIRAFPDREPLEGWYTEGEVPVMETQIRWMAEGGLSFVAFDWYWTNGRPRNEHAVRAYQQAGNKGLLHYTLLWANHEKHPTSMDDFKTMVAYWADQYFKDKEYLKIDGKPVVFIFAPPLLEAKAKAFDSSTTELLATARAVAREHGLPGLYVIGSAPAGEFARKNAKLWGYDALSSYNYSAGRSIGLLSSYDLFDAGYQEHWNWIVQNANLPYVIPMSSGWDKRPWGGSPDPRRDQASSTPEQFQKHLQAARALMDQNPDKTMRMGVICCWNEYGEGSYIEPTKKYGQRYLQAVKSVFGANATAPTK